MFQPGCIFIIFVILSEVRVGTIFSKNVSPPILLFIRCVCHDSGRIVVVGFFFRTYSAGIFK